MNRILFILLFLSTQLLLGQENDSINKQKSFRIRAYKPIYFLFNHTNNVNTYPRSINPLNTVEQRQYLDDTELKFQLSFKAKVTRIRKIWSKSINADIYIAYTQTSRWQIFNSELSRPFRETNYEPEFFVNIPFDSNADSWKGVFWGFGFNHQSNGRSLPFSRSWNRFIFQLGLERDHYFILLKPWLRIKEEITEDDNPDIEDYIGRFELTSGFNKGDHSISLALRHSLKTGSKSRGSFKVNYAYRAFGYLKLNAQIFTGYGESLLDYNHRQTTFGLGISLVDWLDKF
jgi:phospholipase A1